MKNKILAALFILLPLSLFAQQGGIKGKIVSRIDRLPLAGVSVTTRPATKGVITDSNGNFIIEGVEAGTYMVDLNKDEYEELTLTVRVLGEVKDIYTFVMIPAVFDQPLDDMIFAEFDTESVNDAMSVPTSISGGYDLFTNVASYQFSEMRFNVRGYDSKYSDVYLNGIRMNDVLTGYSPWSLWSGLNEATRNKETTSGLESFSYGLGSLGASTNILARASHLRQGWTTSLVGANAMYSFRAMATYASGMQDNGWAYAFSASTRQGGNSFTEGTFYNTIGYFASVEKLFADDHLLSFTILGAPTERAVSQASTQEVYDLVGSNYYNPNWGYQSGTKRNARVKTYHEPVAMINYEYNISENTKLNAATSLRFGKNGYSALTWYAGNDPRPDYYRKLPSYDRTPNPGLLADQWMRDVDHISHVNWDELYNINYNSVSTEDYADGNRAIYMVEDRHTDQRDFNLSANISHIFKNNSLLTGGALFRRNKTEYYSEVKDLLGADFWIDVDKFAERDFAGNDISFQNNMDYYEKYGHPEVVFEGDKFGYDYYANVLNSNIWANYDFVFAGVPTLDFSLGGELGYASLWREGLWRKGLFPEDSKGVSEKLNYLTYKFKANLAYTINAAHNVSANFAMIQNAPTFKSAFISPRTRNSVAPGIDTEKVMSADIAYNLRYSFLQFALNAYYSKISDQTEVISFYNDLQSSFDNFAMSGIDKRYMGLEMALKVPIWNGISVNSALSLGDHIYTSAPYFIEMADNRAEALSEGNVYWEGMAVEESPQTAINLGLAYQSPDYLFLNLDMNYYDRNYLSMNPLYRTDDVLTNLTSEEIDVMRAQERFAPSFTLNASIGKSWSIQRKYYLGVNLSIKNILDNRNIKTGGYEQMRLDRVELPNGDNIYQRFDSKYFYLIGRNYYLNVYLRF